MRSVLLLAALFATSAAHAIIVTIEPDNYAVGTDLSHVTPGVTVSRLHYAGGGAGGMEDGPNSPATLHPVYAVEDSHYSSTGSRMFGGPWLGGVSGDGWSYLCYLQRGPYCSEGFDVFLFDFDQPTDFVSVLAQQTSDTGWMLAYDRHGNEIAACQRGELSFTRDPACITVIGQWRHSSAGIFEMSFARLRADIDSVVLVQASGPVGFDRFRFNRLPRSVPEPSSLALFSLALVAAGVATRRRKFNRE